MLFSLHYYFKMEELNKSKKNSFWKKTKCEILGCESSKDNNSEIIEDILSEHDSSKEQ